MGQTIISRLSVLLHDRDTLAQLLADGYDVSHAPGDFAPLALWAVISGSTAILDLVLERKPVLGVRIGLQRRQYSLLHAAVLLGHHTQARRLCEAGLAPLLRSSPPGTDNVLHVACLAGQAGLLRYFVEECGADPHATTPGELVQLNPAAAQPPAGGQAAPASPPSPVMAANPSIPRDAVEAACIGLRPYLVDVADLLEAVLSRSIEGVQGVTVAPGTFPPWPRGTDGAVALDSGACDVRLGDTTAVLELLVDRYGCGPPHPASQQDPKAALAASIRWFAYARAAAMHANAEALRFMLDRGLLDPPPSVQPLTAAGAGPDSAAAPEPPLADEAPAPGAAPLAAAAALRPPVLAVFAAPAAPASGAPDSAAVAAELAAVRSSLLCHATFGPLAFPPAANQVLQTLFIRAGCRPPFTFRLQLLCPPTALLVRCGRAMPADVAEAGAAVARRATLLAARAATAAAGPSGRLGPAPPALSSLYVPMWARAAEDLARLAKALVDRRPAVAPHYERGNVDETLRPALEGAVTGVLNGLLVARLMRSQVALRTQQRRLPAGMSPADAEAAEAATLRPRLQGLGDEISIFSASPSRREALLWAPSRGVGPAPGASVEAAAASASPSSSPPSALAALLAEEEDAEAGTLGSAPPVVGAGLLAQARQALRQVVEGDTERQGAEMASGVVGAEVARLTAALRRYAADPAAVCLAASLWSAANDVGGSPSLWASAPGRLVEGVKAAAKEGWQAGRKEAAAAAAATGPAAAGPAVAEAGAAPTSTVATAPEDGSEAADALALAMRVASGEEQPAALRRRSARRGPASAGGGRAEIARGDNDGSSPRSGCGAVAAAVSACWFPTAMLTLLAASGAVAAQYFALASGSRR